jgi:DNA-binding response OmpR family regulator
MTKVLVVDDDPSLLKALRIGLTARGDEIVRGAYRRGGRDAGLALTVP